MFEGLIESVLLTYFGEFFENFDSKSLSVSIWSGKVNLTNLVINPHCLDKFKLPFKIRKGSIKSINVSIDWKSNFTTPTIISIDGIFLTISIMGQSEWSFDDSIYYAKKVQMLKAYFAKKTQSLQANLEAKKESKGNSGYIANLTTKIIDNIQLILSNVKVRIVDNNNEKNIYEFGLTLKELQIVSTNSNWEQEFVQRKPDQILFFKKLTLKQMGVYLNISENVKIDQDDQMEGDYSYLIKPINLQCNLIQNTKPNKEENKFALSLSMESLDIELRKVQYDCIVNIMNTVSLYSKFRHCSYNSKNYLYFKPKNKDKKANAKEWMRFMISMVIKTIKTRKGYKKAFAIEKEDEARYKKTFEDNFYSLFIDETSPNYLKDINTIDNDELKEAIEFVDLVELEQWMNPIVATVYQDKDKKEKETKNNSGGWLSFFKTAPKAEEMKEDPEKLNKEREELISMLTGMSAMAEEEKSVSFKYDILLSKGSIAVTDIKREEKTQLRFEKMSFYGNHYGDSMKYAINVISIDVEYIENNYKHYITRRNIDQSTALVEFAFKTFFKDGECHKDISLSVRSQDIAYNKKWMKRFMHFFTSCEVKSNLKDDLYDTMKAFYKTSSSFLKDKVQHNTTKLHLLLDQRKVVVPLSSREDESLRMSNISQSILSKTNENVISFSLGEIEISTPDEIVTVERNSKKFIERMMIKISKIGLKIKEKKIFKDVALDLKVLCQQNKKSNLFISSAVKNFVVNLTPYEYRVLLNISDFLIYHPSKEEKEQNMNEIKKKAKCESLLMKKEYGINEVFKEHYGVISKGYIYLFAKNKEGSNINGTFFLGSECKIAKTDKENFIIHLENRFGRLTLKFYKEDDYINWHSTLTRKINKRALYKVSDETSMKSHEEKEDNDPNEIKLSLQFVMTSMSIYFMKSFVDINNSDIVNGYENDFNVKFGQSEIVIDASDNRTNINFNLFDIECVDDKINKKVIVSNVLEKGDKFVDIRITAINKEAPEYKLNKTSVFVDINIGGVNCVYHPLRMNHMLNIFRKLRIDDDAPIMNEKGVTSIVTCESNANVIEVTATLNHVDIVFVLPKSNTKFFGIKGQSPTVKVIVNNDHFKIKGDLKNCMLYSMTNYPKTIVNVDNINDETVPKHIMLSAKENSQSLIDFDIDLHSITCPHVKDKVTTIVKVNMNRVYFILMMEEFLRILSYMSNEIFPSFSHQEKPLLEEENKAKEEDTRMSMMIKVFNPQLIIKPKYTSIEEFVVDFGDVEIDNKYNGFSIPNNNTNEVDTFKMHTFRIKFNNAMITTENFSVKVSNPFNGIINIHLIDHTLLQWKSYTQLDWVINEIDMTMRLIDYASLIRVFYCNFGYGDNLDRFFTFDEFKDNVVAAKPNEIIDSAKQRATMMFNIVINQTVLKVKFDHNEPFASLEATRIMMGYTSYNTKDKDITVTVERAALYEYPQKQILFPESGIGIDINDDFGMLIENCTPLMESQIKMYLSKQKLIKFTYRIFPQKDSAITVKIAQVKLFAKFDVLYLLFFFFIEKMPNDDNVYEETEEVKKYITKRRVIVEMKAPCFCLLSNDIDDINNKMNNNVIVVATEYFYFAFNKSDEEKLKRNYIVNQNGVNQEVDLSMMKIFISKTEVFITTIGSFLQGITAKDISRKFIDSFDFNYTSTTKLKPILSLQNVKFSSKTYYDIALSTALNISLSYRDMLFALSVKEYEMAIFSTEHLMTKCEIINNAAAAAPQQQNETNQDSSALTVTMDQGLNVVLINDEDDTCYPFVSLVIYNILVNCDFAKEVNTIDGQTNIKLSTYNTFVSCWEPFIEEIGLKIKYEYDIIKDKMKVDVNDLSNLMNNVNVSDMAIEFLYLNMTKWTQYCSSISSSQLMAARAIAKSAQKTISNHRVYNYTGNDMTLINDSNETTLLKPNESVDIAYQNINRKKVYVFSMRSTTIQNNKINIDIIQSSKHQISNQFINSMDYNAKYNFITSKVMLCDLKKMIYFYSPLSFKNITSVPVVITIISKPKKDITVVLNKDEMLGIPVEYFNGTISITPDGFKSGFSKKIYTLLEANGIVEEMSDRNKYLLLFAKNTKKSSNSVDDNRIIYIRYSYCVKNLLPFDIVLKVKGVAHENAITLCKGNEMFTDNISFFSNLEVSMQIPNITLESDVMLYRAINKNKHKGDAIESVIVYDLKGNDIELSTICLDDEKRIVVIYASTVLINLCELDSEVKFYYGNKSNSLSLIPTQENIANVFIVNPNQENIYVSSHRMLSKKIALKTLANITEVTCGEEKSEIKYNFILESKISLVDKEMNIYANVLTLRPKFYINNKTSYLFNVYIADNKSKVKAFPNGKKYQYDFFGFNDKTKLIFRPYDTMNNKEDFLESNPFALTDINIRTISMVDTNAIVHFFNIERHNEENSTIIEIKDANENTSQMLIVNKLSDAQVDVYQENNISSRIVVECNRKQIFTWHNHYTLKLLSLKTSYMKQSKKIKINYNNVDGNPFPYTMTFNDDRGKEINVNFIVAGPQVKIIVDDTEESNDIVDSAAFNTKYEIRFFLSKLCLSLIGDNRNISSVVNSNEYARTEICVISLVDMKVMFKNQICALNKNLNKNCVSFFILTMMIGNETSTSCYFPRVFNPIVDSKEETIPLFNFLSNFDVNTEDRIVNMELLNFSFLPFELLLESNFVFEIYNWVQNVTLGTKTSMMSIHPVFIKEEEKGRKKTMKYFMKDNHIDFINNEEVMNNNELLNNLFIKKIEITSFEFMFTFMNQSGDFFKNFLKTNQALSSLLSVMTNIKDVKIELNGCNISNFFGTYLELINAVFLHYKTHVMNQYLRIFAGIEILGNPNSLFNTLSEGVTDLFTQPKKGFKKGPLQGLVGLAKGGASLVSHTVEGAFGTASKITSGVSTSLLTIGQDEDYMRKREKNAIKDKPENVFEGLFCGMKSFGKGVVYGVTDIVRQPIKEMKKEKNILGFGKGLLKGLGGAITKPVSGVFDLISNTAEGIKNNVKESSVEGLVRYPRPFYGKFKVIKEYNIEHAKIITALMVSEWKAFETHTIGFCNVVQFCNKSNKKTYLIITTSRILQADELYKIDSFKVDIDTLTNLRYDRGNIVFSNGKKDKVIALTNQASPEKIYAVVKKEIENLRETK